MPRLRSDDSHRRLRSVWLGPRGTSLWFEWTYSQWLMLILGATAGGWGTTLLLRLVLDGTTAGIYGVILGGGLGGWFGVRLAASASYDEPLLYRLRMFAHLLTATRRKTPGPLTIATRLPPITDLSPGARRALGQIPDPSAPTTSKELDVIRPDSTPTPRRRTRPRLLTRGRARARRAAA